MTLTLPYPPAVSSATEGNVQNSYLVLLLQYCYLYGCQIVIFAVLSVMTAYRRELSSNRVYLERHHEASRGEGSNNSIFSKSRSLWHRLVILDQDETDLDNLLEGAGNVCGPIFSVIISVWARVTFARHRFIPNAKVGRFAASNRTTSAHGGESADRAELGSPSFLQAGEQLESNEEGKTLGSKVPSTLREKLNPLRRFVTVIDLPPDAHIHILSFLHPRDIVQFACASRGAHGIVDDETVGEEGHSTSVLLWKELWKRDYAWVVSEWDVGKHALARSVGRTEDFSDTGKSEGRKMNSVFKHLESSIAEESIEEAELQKDPSNEEVESEVDGVSVTHVSMKDFYFTFVESWLNYTIAGRNTNSRCLVGLHGHVFDISDFVEQHPGSPETLLVQSGRDATPFFEDLGHSLGARKMALTMCVVLDRSCAEGGRGKGCGLLRTVNKKSMTDKSPARNLPKASWARSETAKKAIPLARSKPRRPGNLNRIRTKLDKEEQQAQIAAEKWLARTLTRDGILGNIHVYYDVFVGRWMAWFTDRDFQPVFLDRIDA